MSMPKTAFASLLLLWPALAEAAPAASPDDESPPAQVTGAGAAAAPPAPPGFFRDERGRLMQVSFDLQDRLWLGVSYAPRRRASGDAELVPAAFDFGFVEELHAPDGRTRHRIALLQGEARMSPFGLDVTAFRYDLSHAYDFPLLRLTTLWSRPRRHDLFLNVGLYTEAGHLQTAPHGEAGNHELSLASVQGTLDLWQSWDLRSYLRLRVGPVVHLRFGPWHEEARTFTSLPETALEGSFLLGERALQQLEFHVQGQWLRTFALRPESLARDLELTGEASWEIILLAINDQPVSFRLAGRVDAQKPDRRQVLGAASEPAAPRGWDPEWSLTAGVRMSFLSPPIAPSPRR
jgi:hypothetical protein